MRLGIWLSMPRSVLGYEDLIDHDELRPIRAGGGVGKENEPADPVQVRIGVQAVMLHADPLMNLAEQSGGCHAVTPCGCLYWTYKQVPIPVDVIEDSRS